MTPTTSHRRHLGGSTRPPAAARAADGHGDHNAKSRPEAPDNHRNAPQRGNGNDPRTDERLLLDYRRGDAGAFVLLMERHQRELFHFLYRFLGNRAAAEDTFQEAFLQVHQSAASFDPRRRFRPWLFTIAANKARDLMRAQSRRPASPLEASIHPNETGSGRFIDLMESPVESPDTPLERKELSDRIHSAVMEMPSNLREILLLSYFQQFAYKQISEILGIPIGTVKSRLHSAVACFAERWRAMNQRRS